MLTLPLPPEDIAAEKHQKSAWDLKSAAFLPVAVEFLTNISGQLVSFQLVTLSYSPLTLGTQIASEPTAEPCSAVRFP